jgi:hypothetical protein
MSLDFSNVKSWNIPEGEVLSASLNGVTIYTKPVEHTYEPTNTNGDGLYGLVDGQYVPLTCTATRSSYKYTKGSPTGSTVSSSTQLYIYISSGGGTWKKSAYTTADLYNDSKWNQYNYYTTNPGTSSSLVYRTIIYSYSYTDPYGNTYTGQRYIQTS